MKLPIDTMCATTGSLCRSCAAKLRNGEITDLDVQASKIIVKTVGKNKRFKDLIVKRVIQGKEKVYVIVGKGQVDLFMDPMIGLVNQLSDMTGQDIIVLEEPQDVNALIETFLSPVIPISITKVYIPPFSEEGLKITIKKEDEERIPLDSDELNSLLNSLGYKVEAYFVYV